MIRRMYRALPGPTPLRIVISVGALVIFLVVLHFCYEWIGNTFLDTGGTVG